MKKSRLPLIIFSIVAALAVGAILVGLISYFVLSADASPTNAQTVPQTNQLDATAPDQIDQTDTAAPGQFTVPDSQKPSALDSGQIQINEGSKGEEQQESEEHERQEQREFGN